MYSINITDDNTIRYPLHVHQQYEVMVYLEGVGYLETDDKRYPFSPGSIIIVPPRVKHGSVSKNGFRNISIKGSFENLFTDKFVFSFSDNDENEIVTLAKLIYNNRYKDKSFLNALCSAFTKRLILETNNKNQLLSAIDNIISKINKEYYDSELNLGDIMSESSYAKDYVRAKFKHVTKKTPSSFLNEVRINHACFLINIYGNSIPLNEISEKCGYTDYVYFSKRFKMITGMSPSEYKKAIISVSVKWLSCMAVWKHIYSVENRIVAVEQ